ncbi:hypothetical protein CDAR_255411, partial [Caerostris darwini]
SKEAVLLEDSVLELETESPTDTSLKMHFDAIWILSFTKTNRSFRNISRKTSSGDISLGNPYDKRALARNQPNSSKVLTAFRAMERTE